MDGLNFLESYWIIYYVNVTVINCNAPILTLDIRYVANVTIENSTFGKWLFGHVSQVFLKNCRSLFVGTFRTAIDFYNSSGFIENITIKDLVFRDTFGAGLWVQKHSYVKITKSNFLDNTMTRGLITVVDSGTLVMLNCNLKNNSAIDYSGAIHIQRSNVYLINTSINNNKAVDGAGALGTDESYLYIQNCTFSNNTAKFNNSKHGWGGAISLANSTLKGINVSFTGNTANIGGTLWFVFQSKLKMHHVYFSNNTADAGSVAYGSFSSEFLCKNCSLFQNQDLDNNSDSTAITLHHRSVMNVSGFKCESHRGYLSSCIAAVNSNMFIYNATFSMNIGSTIAIMNNSHLVTVNSYFLNNFKSDTQGGAIFSHNSTSNISHCIFCHNRAGKGGSLFMVFSTAVLNNCEFQNESNTAVALIKNTTTSIVNCTFENNSSPWEGGALYIYEFSVVNTSCTTFLNSTGAFGGAITVAEHSVLAISNCSFSMNTALFNIKVSNSSRNKTLNGQGGGILVQGSILVIFQSQFYNNYAEGQGGSISAANKASILIGGTYFENNTAGLHGGALCVFNQSFLTINESHLMSNTVVGFVDSRGGGLHTKLNCTVIISSVHFVECEAQQGGAIYISDFSQTTMLNSILVANKGDTMLLLNSVSSHIIDCRFLNNSLPLAVSLASSANVTNTLFNYNSAHNGGVLFAEILSHVSFYNCSFTGNTAYEGGVLFVDNSDVSLIGSNFTGNSATNGGVFQISGYLFISHCMMNNTRANGDGGVGYIDENSQINITKSIFRANSALNNGGVFWIRKSTVTICNSSFKQNEAGFLGGVVNAEYNSKINITRTKFFGNKGHHGGVLHIRWNTTLLVQNSKMLWNSADICATAIMDDASVLEISLSKLHMNNVNQRGYALCAVNNSVFIFRSSIFTGNTGYSGSINLLNSTGYLENCTLIGNRRQNIGTILISASQLSISSTILEQNVEKDGVDIDSDTTGDIFINKLYTYKCLIKHDNTMFKSNTTNFKQIAIKEHVLRKISANNLATEETQFASGELLSLNIVY